MNAVIQKPSVLCISAVDPMGMSGVHADLRALDSMGVHGLSCITATTAQNQKGFTALNLVSGEAFKSQLDALYEQDVASVIKIGLLANAQQVKILLAHPIFKDKKVVLDPVLSATAGDIEHHDERLAALKLLMCGSTVLTPNLDEAKTLLDIKIGDESDEQELAVKLLSHNIRSVLIKGGHSDSPSKDFYSQGDVSFYLEHPVYDNSFSRGTGCTMASLIAGALALGSTTGDAVTMAKMQMAAGWKQPFSIDDQTGTLTLPKWQDPMAYKAGAELGEELGEELNVELPEVFRYEENKSLNFPPCEQPLGLYPIFERAAWLEAILPLGVRIAQIRIKDLEGEALKGEIQKAVDIGKKYNCMLFINDYWQLAIECGAYGVHLGQEDIDKADLKAIADAGLRLGLSSHCFYEVARAKTIDPSYIAFGPVYETQTKDMPWIPQGPQGLHYWRAHLPNKPMVAIGGIHGDRFDQVRETGVDSIAMITAITLADEPERTAKQYMDKFVN